MCVHSRHCCRNHGCKYGDADCSVWLGFSVQEGICDLCFEDGVTEVRKIPKPSCNEYKKRRDYADPLNPCFDEWD